MNEFESIKNIRSSYKNQLNSYILAMNNKIKDRLEYNRIFKNEFNESGARFAHIVICIINKRNYIRSKERERYPKFRN